MESSIVANIFRVEKVLLIRHPGDTSNGWSGHISLITSSCFVAQAGNK